MADSRSNRLRPRRMNETISGVADGVLPDTVAFFSTIGPRPCATATSPAGTDDDEATNDKARNDGTARAATSAPVAAITTAAIRRPPESFTEWSPSLTGQCSPIRERGNAWPY